MPAAKQQSVKERQPQEARTAAMRERLLTATINTLFNDGWSKASTPRITRKAGVSRGAQTHHFPTKADLVIAAIERLADEYGQAFETEGNEAEVADAVQYFWKVFSDRRFLESWLELLVAARTDADLKKKVVIEDAQLFDRMTNMAEALSEGEADNGLADRFLLTTYLLRGMALERMVRGSEKQRRRLYDLWLTLAFPETQNSK